MLKSVPLLTVAVVVAASLHHPPLAAAAPVEVVVANQALRAGGEHVPANLDRLLRRLEEVGGWPQGSLRGKAFVNPREALSYIRKNRVPFAVLPPHQLVEARKELRLEVLGRAVGLEGTQPGYWGVTLAGKRPWEHIEETPGLRLALTEGYDEQWVRVLMEGNVSAPRTHFKLIEVASDEEALAAVLARRADVALIYESTFTALKTRVRPGGDLAWVYATGNLPPLAVVATRFATAADRKKLTAALAKVCKGDPGAEACGRMALMYMEPGHSADYNEVIQKYAGYR